MTPGAAAGLSSSEEGFSRESTTGQAGSGTRIALRALRGYPLGQMHKGRLQIDLVFLETVQPEAGFD